MAFFFFDYDIVISIKQSIKSEVLRQLVLKIEDISTEQEKVRRIWMGEKDA